MLEQSTKLTRVLFWRRFHSQNFKSSFLHNRTVSYLLMSMHGKSVAQQEADLIARRRLRAMEVAAMFFFI